MGTLFRLVCLLFPVPAWSLGLEANRTSSMRARLGFLYFLFMCGPLICLLPTSNTCRVAFHGEVEFPYLVLDLSSPLRGCTGRTSALDLPASQQPLLPRVADLLLWAVKNRTHSWKKMEELKLTEVSQPEPSLETKCTKFPRWVSLCSGHCKSRFLTFAYALPAQLLSEWEGVFVFHAWWLKDMSFFYDYTIHDNFVFLATLIYSNIYNFISMVQS